MIDIQVISVGTSEMQLKWGNTDGTSGYHYHIVLVSEHSPHETNKTTVSQKAVTLKGLTPGTLYNVTISPELEKVQGDSSSIAQYTRESCGDWGWEEGALFLSLMWRKYSNGWRRGGLCLWVLDWCGSCLI